VPRQFVDLYAALFATEGTGLLLRSKMALSSLNRPLRNKSSEKGSFVECFLDSLRGTFARATIHGSRVLKFALSGGLNLTSCRIIRAGMKRAFQIVFAVAGTILSLCPAQAHHSFEATYLADKTVVLDGVLSQFLFSNPHSLVQIDTEESGHTVRWYVEWSSAGVLRRSGITQNTLRPGDHVTIVGNPSRHLEDHRARLISIKRLPDGWKWSRAQD
jgi:hypothetical protein